MGDDTCGECAAVYLAAKDGFISTDFVADPDSMVAYVRQLRQKLGMDPTTGGTTLLQEFSALTGLADLLGCHVVVESLIPQPNNSFNFSDYPGYGAIIGVDLSVMDPNVTGDHFLLFDANSGKAWHALDSCHDIDGSLGSPTETYDIDTVLKAAVALFGDGKQIGWLAKFYSGDSPVTPPTPTPPMDEATQNAMINSEMDRETHLAVAAFAMAQMLDKLPTNMIDTSLQQTYRAHLNAVDPSRFVF